MIFQTRILYSTSIQSDLLFHYQKKRTTKSPPIKPSSIPSFEINGATLFYRIQPFSWLDKVINPSSLQALIDLALHNNNNNFAISCGGNGGGEAAESLQSLGRDLCMYVGHLDPYLWASDERWAQDAREGEGVRADALVSHARQPVQGIHEKRITMIPWELETGSSSTLSCSCSHHPYPYNINIIHHQPNFQHSTHHQHITPTMLLCSALLPPRSGNDISPADWYLSNVRMNVNSNMEMGR